MAPPLTGSSLIAHRIGFHVATLPFGSVLADAPKSKNAKVTLV
jgi:hypothetical protein